MKELTQWFTGSVLPVRNGVYQVLINGREKYARWADQQWHLALRDYDRAKQSGIRSTQCYTNDFGGWRGLARAPK
jgi:hypothetical protein